MTRRCVGHFRKTTKLASEGVSAPSWIEGIDFSDQLPSWHHGYLGVMVTDTSFFRNPNYHKESDTADTLDYDRLARVTSGLHLVQELAGTVEKGK